jgi:tetratricopeptide (TPR) repeat protein
MRPAARSILSAILVSVLIGLTFTRTLAFRSEKSLYADSISKNPNGWMTQTNYGVILGSEGDLDGAEAHLRRAMEIHPVNGIAADRLGLLFEARRQDAQALDWFHKAIELEPKLGSPYYDLAKLLDRQGKISAALTEYELAIKVQHNSAPAHLDYGVLLASLARYTEAAAQFKEAIRIDPASALPRRNLIAALERSGQLDEAADQIHNLLAMRPDDAMTYNNLGLVETGRHNRSAAMAAFSRALAIDPGLSEAREHLDALAGQAATQPVSP